MDKEDKKIEPSIYLALMRQQANPNLGITKEYNSENRTKLWDDQKGKSNYKDSVFGNKLTYIDPISGKTLHKSQNAAQNKYHMKNKAGENISFEWAKYSAEVDHINALKDAHNVAKYNPFLSNTDFKEIMNSNANYRILSKYNNTSKGAKNDWNIIMDKDSTISTQGKIQIAKEKIVSDVVIQQKFAIKTSQNVVKEFTEGAMDTLVKSVIPLSSEAVRRMVKVAQGEESLSNTTKEMGKFAVDVAIAGGKHKLKVDKLANKLASSKNPYLNNIAESEEIAQIINVTTIIQEAAKKYINGEIDENEFIEEVGEKGTTIVAGMISKQLGKEVGGIIGAVMGTIASPGVGTVAGHVVGEVVGIIITTVACSSILSIYNTSKHFNDYKLKESQIKQLELEALKEMENQRDKFRNIIEKEYNYWDENIKDGFNMIISSACEQTFNLQGITDGLDKILKLFGKSVEFKNLDEYENQLDIPLNLKF